MAQATAALLVVKRAFGDWWYGWVGLALINIVWALAVLTLILAPPATVGAFYAANQAAQGQSIRFGDFISGFRRYFLVSYGWGLLNVIAAILVYSSILFYGQMGSDLGLLLLSLVLMIATGWVIVQFYALPYLIEQERKNVLVALRNGLFTLFASPLYSLVLALVVALIIGLSVALVALLFLGGPFLVALLANYAVRERLVTFGLRSTPDSPTDNTMS